MYSNSDFHDSWCEQNRSTIAIPHPLGNPALEKDEEYALRKGLVEKALKALTTEVDGQTIFDN